MTALQPGTDISDFVELHFKPGMWENEGIPEQGCRIRSSSLENILHQRGSYEVDDLIRGLMDWLDVTHEPQPALETLRQLLDQHYPSDGLETGRCQFADEHGVDRSFTLAGLNPISR